MPHAGFECFVTKKRRYRYQSPDALMVTMVMILSFLLMMGMAFIPYVGILTATLLAFGIGWVTAKMPPLWVGYGLIFLSSAGGYWLGIHLRFGGSMELATLLIVFSAVWGFWKSKTGNYRGGP